ncbi:NrtA/SsuA/CpmA family ABC transporter substrate-binding protein [Microbacteriaceae bacterium K1510]|nr:NrtA/SsuA/CpmA family ABC transporter substrate-binding protein [Microbacteriaceae bacterium K1510]
MSMTPTRRAITGALALGAALLAGAAQAADTVRIAVGVDSGYVPFFVATQQGYFKDAGLDVQYLTFSQGGDALDGVIAGQADITAAAEPTTMIRIGRADVRPLFIISGSGTYIKLVARPEITDPTQIKKFGYVPGNVSEYAMGKTLEKYKIDPKSIELVRAGPPELPALLARGDIDAFFNIEPWPTLAVKQGAKVLLTSKDIGYSYTYWITASGAWLDGHKEQAQKVVQSLAKACDAINADPNVGANATQAQVKIPAAQTLQFLKEVECKARDFNDEDMKSFDQIADFLANTKVTPKKVDYAKALQRGFYKP